MKNDLVNYLTHREIILKSVAKDYVEKNKEEPVQAPEIRDDKNSCWNPNYILALEKVNLSFFADSRFLCKTSPRQQERWFDLIEFTADVHRVVSERFSDFSISKFTDEEANEAIQLIQDLYDKEYSKRICYSTMCGLGSYKDKKSLILHILGIYGDKGFVQLPVANYQGLNVNLKPTEDPRKEEYKNHKFNTNTFLGLADPVRNSRVDTLDKFPLVLTTKLLSYDINSFYGDSFETPNLLQETAKLGILQSHRLCRINTMKIMIPVQRLKDLSEFKDTLRKYKRGCEADYTINKSYECAKLPKDLPDFNKYFMFKIRAAAIVQPLEDGDFLNIKNGYIVDYDRNRPAGCKTKNVEELKKMSIRDFKNFSDAEKANVDYFDIEPNSPNKFISSSDPNELKEVHPIVQYIKDEVARKLFRKRSERYSAPVEDNLEEYKEFSDALGSAVEGSLDTEEMYDPHYQYSLARHLENIELSYRKHKATNVEITDTDRALWVCDSAVRMMVITKQRAIIKQLFNDCLELYDRCDDLTYLPSIQQAAMHSKKSSHTSYKFLVALYQELSYQAGAYHENRRGIFQKLLDKPEHQNIYAQDMLYKFIKLKDESTVNGMIDPQFEDKLKINSVFVNDALRFANILPQEVKLLMLGLSVFPENTMYFDFNDLEKATNSLRKNDKESSGDMSVDGTMFKVLKIKEYKLAAIELLKESCLLEDPSFNSLYRQLVS